MISKYQLVKCQSVIYCSFENDFFETLAFLINGLKEKVKSMIAIHFHSNITAHCKKRKNWKCVPVKTEALQWLSSITGEFGALAFFSPYFTDFDFVSFVFC